MNIKKFASFTLLATASFLNGCQNDKKTLVDLKDFTKEQLFATPLTLEVATQLENAQAHVKGYEVYFSSEGYYSLNIEGKTQDNLAFVLAFKDKNHDHRFGIQELEAACKTVPTFLDNSQSMTDAVDATTGPNGIQNFLSPLQLNQ